MKQLSEPTLTALREYLFEQQAEASMDDWRHFVTDVLRDGYNFEGYANMSQEDCLAELLDELEVDDVRHITPEDLRGRGVEVVSLVHTIITELE